MYINALCIINPRLSALLTIFFIWAAIHFVLASMLMMVLVHHFQLFSLSSLVQHFKNFSSKLPLFASSRHPPLWRSRKGAHGVQSGASPPLFWIPFHADHGLRVLVPSLFNPPPNQTLAPIALYCEKGTFHWIHHLQRGWFTCFFSTRQPLLWSLKLLHTPTFIGRQFLRGQWYPSSLCFALVYPFLCAWC